MAFADTSIKFTVDDSTLLVGLTGIQKAVEQVSANMAKMTSQGGNQGLEKQVSLLDTLKTNWVAFSAAAVGAWMAVNKAMEFVELGAKALQAEESFHLVAASSGIAADTLLANLDRAAAGTVDDSDLMQSAVKGMILGLDDKQLPAIMDAARIAARYAGTDVKTAFEDISNAIGTDMPRMLKRYGLITREETKQVQAAISAGAKDVSLYSIAMAHAEVNSAKFGIAQANAAEQVQKLRVVVNETKETAGKVGIGIAAGLTATLLGFDAFATRLAAGAAKAVGAKGVSADLMAGHDEMIRKAAGLLGVQTEAEKKAAEASDAGARTRLNDARAVLAAEQAKVKAAAEWGKTSTDALKTAEEGIKTYEEELKAENAVNAEAIAARDAALAASFNARKALGQTSMADEVAELRRRAELQWQDTAKRIEDNAKVEQATREMTDRIFEHEKTLGMQSLQDEIDFQKKKAAAAVAGSTARMTAEENVYKKEQELRDRRNAAASGILGKVIQRLKDKGVESASREDVERELGLMRREEGKQGDIASNWAGSGTNVRNLAEVQAGFGFIGEENARNRLGLGSAKDIFRGGSQRDPSLPWTPAESGGATDALGAGIESGLQTSTDRAFATFDTFATKLTERANEAGSQIAQTFYANMEDWFVRKLVGQSERA